MESGPLRAFDLLCLSAALASIAVYVAALLRNRPYLRPFGQGGLLLLGGGLLCLPSIFPEQPSPETQVKIAAVTALLVGSALLQGISALRRRRARRPEAAS